MLLWRDVQEVRRSRAARMPHLDCCYRKERFVTSWPITKQERHQVSKPARNFDLKPIIQLVKDYLRASLWKGYLIESCWNDKAILALSLWELRHGNAHVTWKYLLSVELHKIPPTDSVVSCYNFRVAEKTIRITIWESKVSLIWSSTCPVSICSPVAVSKKLCLQYFFL